MNPKTKAPKSQTPQTCRTFTGPYTEGPLQNPMQKDRTTKSANFGVGPPASTCFRAHALRRLAPVIKVLEFYGVRAEATLGALTITIGFGGILYYVILIRSHPK